MNFDEIQQRSREIFRIEAADLLGELESSLLELEAAPGETAILHRVFRVMHTLKGSGATSGYQDLSSFLHHVEDVYNAAREGRVAVSSTLIDLTLKIGDTIRRYLAATATEAQAVLAAAQPHLNALLAFMPTAGTAHETIATAKRLSVRFQPHAHLFQTGNDPGVFLDDLRNLAPCVIKISDTQIPPLQTLDPEACYLSWNIEFTAPVKEEAIREVFQFVEGDCDLDIQPVADPVDDPDADLFRDPTTSKSEIQNPKSDIADFKITLPPAAASSEISNFKSDPLNNNTLSPNAEISPQNGRRPTATVSDTLRVSSDRLDRLVNLIGELVILKSVVSNACAQNPDIPPALHAASETLQSLTTQLRDEVLNIRMMQIGQTFSKFRRLARDLSRELGKQVELVVEGSETEMDKTILERLNDPLVHLVRNSLDHGLETPDERIATGKPVVGKLRLSAAQKGDRVVISVGDDGRGLDPAAIRAKAIERGLLQPDATLTDNELFQMVFLPGFSTAKAVSSLSGRGVGLDVVKRTIDQLRGRIELRSTHGKGAEFRLSLPLTLAIIDGLMVSVGKDHYILPLSAARETIDLPPSHRADAGRRNLVDLRGEFIPYLRLRDLFDYGTPPPALRERVVIVELEQSRLGLVVDEVLGNHQTVIKSLGWIAPEAPVYSGATVLGDGRVALIIDIPALAAYAAQQTGISSLAKT
ncbi:MAG: chemotaxis protein CheA [Nibricoccus sp.]